MIAVNGCSLPHPFVSVLLNIIAHPEKSQCHEISSSSLFSRTVSADAPHFNTMLVSGDMQVVGESKFIGVAKSYGSDDCGIIPKKNIMQ